MKFGNISTKIGNAELTLSSIDTEAVTGYIEITIPIGGAKLEISIKRWKMWSDKRVINFFVTITENEEEINRKEQKQQEDDDENHEEEST